MKNLLLRLWREEEGQDLTEYAFRKYKEVVVRLWRGDEGQDLVEYGLLVLLFLIAVASIQTVGKVVSHGMRNG